MLEFRIHELKLSLIAQHADVVWSLSFTNYISCDGEHKMCIPGKEGCETLNGSEITFPKQANFEKEQTHDIRDFDDPIKGCPCPVECNLFLNHPLAQISAKTLKSHNNFRQ